MVRQRSTATRKSYGFRIDVELVNELKILAVTQDKPVNMFPEEAIQDLLAKHKRSSAGSLWTACGRF